MTKGKQDKSGFNGVYLQGRGPGVVALRPSFLDEEEREKEREKKEKSVSDEDTSHLPDERYRKHSFSPIIQNWKKKRSGFFVR